MPLTRPSKPQIIADIHYLHSEIPPVLTRAQAATWLRTIADVLTYHHGEGVPQTWGVAPSAAPSGSYAYDVCTEVCPAALVHLGNSLL